MNNQEPNPRTRIYIPMLTVYIDIIMRRRVALTVSRFEKWRSRRVLGRYSSAGRVFNIHTSVNSRYNEVQYNENLNTTYKTVGPLKIS